MKKLFSAMVPVLAFLMIAAFAAQPGGKRNFVAHLSGADAGVITRAQGQAIFHFSKEGTALTYKLIVADLEDVSMAHMHLSGTPGGNGPPVLWLYPDGPPGQPIPGKSNGVLSVGTVTAANLVGPLAGQTLGDLRQAIEEGRTYVNVHTLAYPPGEIRGEIR